MRAGVAGALVETDSGDVPRLRRLELDPDLDRARIVGGNCARGCMPKIDGLGGCGLTTMLFDVALARFGLVNLSEIVSTVGSTRFVKVATPPDTVAFSVPLSGPVPLASAAVTTVVYNLPFPGCRTGPLHKSPAGNRIQPLRKPPMKAAC